MLAVMMMRVTIIIGIISVPYCTSCGGKSMPTEAIANVNIWNGIVCLGKDCESGKVVTPIESGGRRVCWRQTSKDCGCPAPHLDGISCSPWLQRSRRVNTLLCLVSRSGVFRGCDILLFYSSDAEEWCQYLQDLFLSSRQVRSQKTLTYRLGPETSFSAEDLTFFLSPRCIVVLLSAELVQCLGQPALLPLLQRAFHPPHRMVRLLCGVRDSKEFLDFFPDWAHWQEFTCDDEPETYVAVVKKAISEGKELF